MKEVHPLFNPDITWLNPQQLTDAYNQFESDRRAKLERFDKKPDFDSLPDLAHKRMSKSKWERKQ